MFRFLFCVLCFCIVLCIFRFLFCMFCVSVLFCVLFLLIYIVVSFLLLYKFTDHCHRMETQLQLINIISLYSFLRKLARQVMSNGWSHAHLHVSITARLFTHRFSWNLSFNIFTKICQIHRFFIKRIFQYNWDKLYPLWGTNRD